VQISIPEYGSEFDWDSNNAYINDELKQSYFQGAKYFRSGRDSLKAIALKYKGKYRQLLLPALCCPSMAASFEMNGYDTSYFKLNQDISADFEDLLSKIQKNTILLYMNYFGIPSLTDSHLIHIREQYQDIIIIEDRTHDIFIDRSKQFIPDYTICSIRKWLAIPDGGILYSRFKQTDFPRIKDAYFGDTRKDALLIKSEYIKSGDINLKTLYRNKLSTANGYLDINKDVADISDESGKLLKNIDFEKISQRRCENIQVMSEMIKEISSMKSILTDTNQSALYYPILIENRDIIQQKLAVKNIYCPVIWPLPKMAEGVCELSDYIASHMLALPCDQRYNIDDIEHIITVLKELLRNE